MKITEFDVEIASRHLSCALAEPDGNAADGAAAKLVDNPALLLTFTMSRQESLSAAGYNIPALEFVRAGHRVVSFDLPNHGERPSNQGIAGMRDSFLAGADPFNLFVQDGQGVIDACVKRGLTGSAGIFACGLSRAGYCVLRLAAAEPRIKAVAALAPVTDWSRLTEFAKVKKDPRVAALSLTNYAKNLVGRNVHVVIGNADGRVGTDACVGFMQSLYAAEAAGKIAKSLATLCVDSESVGHGLAERQRVSAVQHLLSQI